MMDLITAVLVQFVNLADGIKLSVLVAMIFANVLLGIAVSIYSRTFRLKAIADFLLSRILPYIISYFAVVFIAIVEPAWKIAVTIVWGIIIAALAGAILANLKEMGISLPDSLAGTKKEKEE